VNPPADRWNWRRVWTIARKEWLHLRRDPQSIGLIILLPLITLVLYGYAINFDLKHIPMGILDRDRTQRSRALRDAFLGNEYFRFVGDVSSEADIEPLFRQGVVRAVIVIPRGFDADVSAARTPNFRPFTTVRTARQPALPWRTRTRRLRRSRRNRARQPC